MYYYVVNLVPRIVYPPSNLHPITFTNSASSVQLMCSLNMDIPSSVKILWMCNNNTFIIVPPNEVIITGNTTTLVLQNPQPSDAGLYQCIFEALNVGGSFMLG